MGEQQEGHNFPGTEIKGEESIPGSEAISSNIEEFDHIERLLNLREQYENQKEILQRIGILEKLSNGEIGTRGIDNKEYILPSYQGITERIIKNQEILKTKIEQGFQKLLIVPFGMKLDDLIEKYRQVILKHYKEGKLLATKKEPTDPDRPLGLDQDQPLWKDDQHNNYNNADIEGKLIYYPKKFSKNHQGKTKQEILNQTKEGFNILLIENLPNVPKGGREETSGVRALTPDEYLEIIQTKSRHQDEQGMTPEDQITYAITHLEETNQVIDDYRGNGTASYQLGAYFFATSEVPLAYWSQNSRQACLDCFNPWNRYATAGIRTKVKV